MELIIKILQLKITKIFLFLLFVVFVLSLFFCRHWYITQYHKAVGFYYVHKGDKAYKNRKYQQAIELYKIALRNYPGHSRASCNLGNIYVSFENYYEAVNSYERALKYSPDFMACRMDLGIILSEKMANYDKAIQEYGRVIESRPFTINIPFVFNNAKAAKTNKGIAYYNMGLAYRGKSVYMGEHSSMSRKYLRRAKEAYKKAEKYLKNDYDNTFNMALTDHLLGNYSDSANEYCKAINLYPDRFEAHYNFALLLRSMHLNKEALEEFEKTTLLLDYYGSKSKNKYIFGIINEIKRRIMSEGGSEYLNKHEPITSTGYNDIIYSNGKILADKQQDIDINKMLKCTYGKKKKEDKI